MSDHKILDAPDSSEDLRRRVLVVSYAFPPLHVPMSPVVAKVAVGITRNGYGVDVLCAAPFDNRLGSDLSLVSYVQSATSVHRLAPSPLHRLKNRLLARTFGEMD